MKIQSVTVHPDYKVGKQEWHGWVIGLNQVISQLVRGYVLIDFMVLLKSSFLPFYA